MKKIILSSVIALAALTSQSVFADATTICNRPTAAQQGTVPPSATAGTHYMVTPIAPKCSTNVRLNGIDGTGGAWYAVAANSTKGKNTFGGSTGGYAYPPVGCALPGGCSDTEVATALTASNRGT